MTTTIIERRPRGRTKPAYRMAGGPCHHARTPRRRDATAAGRAARAIAASGGTAAGWIAPAGRDAAISTGRGHV